MSRDAQGFLSQGERKGPILRSLGVGEWEGEGVRPIRLTPSSSHASGAGPSFSPWEKEIGSTEPP